MELLGGVAVLVDNAGVNEPAPAGPLSADEPSWAVSLDANLLSAVRLDRLVVPTMVEQGHGCVIHVSSAAARFPQPDSVPYAAAKAALTAYSKGLATAVAPSGVRVVAIMPGLVTTDTREDRMREAAERSGRPVADLRNAFEGRFPTPLGRHGRVDEVAELIAFLASSRASYLPGTQVVVDGGLLPTL